VKEDFDNLLKIPIRRIAKFDLDKNSEECRALEDKEAITLHSLSDIPLHAIHYLETLLKRYGSEFPRRTAIQDPEIVDRREMERKEIELGIDREHGYVGTKITGSECLACTNFDRLLVLLSDGTYKVLNIADRSYVAKTGVAISYCGVADKQQVFTCCYRDTNTGVSFCKRFVVKQYILDREYHFIPEGTELLLLSTHSSPLLVQLVPKQRQRLSAIEVKPDNFPVRGVAAQGIRLSPRPVLAIQQ
jgi:topoisomerase-4 subunit A